MINCIRSADDLNFSSLCIIYEADIELDRRKYYGHLDVAEGRFAAENDMYTYMHESFFNNGGLIYTFSQGNQYACIARIEPYRDGMLLNSVVTADQFRKMGYASALVDVVLKNSGRPIYSHIYRNNKASIKLHDKFGFKKLLNYAILLDGTVCNDHFTYILTD